MCRGLGVVVHYDITGIPQWGSHLQLKLLCLTCVTVVSIGAALRQGSGW